MGVLILSGVFRGWGLGGGAGAGALPRGVGCVTTGALLGTTGAGLATGLTSGFFSYPGSGPFS